VFKKKVHGRIFGPKREKVTAGWRKLHDEEELIVCTLHQMLGNQIKEEEMCGTQNAWEMRNMYKIPDGKPEGKKPFGRYRCR
jgi:hypothetical protein